MGRWGAHPPSLNTTWWPIVEQYCEGKVKRTPGGEWKRTWNPVFTSTQSALRRDVVLFVERSGELYYAARLSYSVVEPKGNRVWTARYSCMHRARNRVTYPCPGWSKGKTLWRAEPTSVEKAADEVWIAEKFQSNPDIAGSPRNSFRASLITDYRR